MINLGTAKAAMDQFVRYVALEVAPHGVTANLVSPATVAGATSDKLLASDDVRRLGPATPWAASSPPTR